MQMTMGLGLPPGGKVPFNPVSLFAKYGASGFYYNFAGSPTRTLGGGLLVPMYQDQAGTVVDADGESIGVAIDESQAAAVGADLVTNGGFDADTDWNKGAGWTISGGVASRDGTAGGSNLGQEMGLSEGSFYRVTWTQSNDFVAVYLGTTSVLLSNVNTAGTHTAVGKCGAGSYLIFRASAAVSSIDDVSVELISGNHSLQSTAAAKPTWKTGSPNYASFDGGDYLISGLAPASGTTIAVCFQAGGSGTRAIISASEGSARSTLELESNGYLQYRGAARSITGATNLTSTDAVGLARFTASTMELFHNGISLGTNGAPGAIPSLGLYLGAENDDSVSINYMTGRIYRAFAIQSYINDSDVVPLMRALGAGVVSI